MGVLPFATGSSTLRLELVDQANVAIKSLELQHIEEQANHQQRIAELNKRGIKLILYYHVGHGDLPDTNWWDRNWNPNWVEENYDKSLFFKNWQNIITEVGERYGEKLAGWLFDDDCVIYPADYETLGQATKAGNSERLVACREIIGPPGC